MTSKINFYVIIGAEPLSSQLNGDFSYMFICAIRPSVNCLNKRSCGLHWAPAMFYIFLVY